MSIGVCTHGRIDVQAAVSVCLQPMAKKRFQCWLSEKALAELERRAGAPDKRQAYLEGLLTESLGRKVVAKLIDATQAEGRCLNCGEMAFTATIPHRCNAPVSIGSQWPADLPEPPPSVMTSTGGPMTFIPGEESDPEDEQQAREARKLKKESKAKRKADLQESVSAVLPERLFQSFPKPTRKGTK